MVVKAEVTPEQKALIKELAAAEGKSVSSYIKEKALCWTDPSAAIGPLMQYIETQAKIAQQMNKLATTVLENKVVYEREILLLLNRMTALEKTTAEFLKEVTGNGHVG